MTNLESTTSEVVQMSQVPSKVPPFQTKLSCWLSWRLKLAQKEKYFTLLLSQLHGSIAFNRGIHICLSVYMKSQGSAASTLGARAPSNEAAAMLLSLSTWSCNSQSLTNHQIFYSKHNLHILPLSKLCRQLALMLQSFLWLPLEASSWLC